MLKVVYKLRQIYKRYGWTGIVNSVKANLAKFSYRNLRLRYAKFYEPTAAELESFRLELEQFPYKPKLSILLPVYNPELEHLMAAVNSVTQQLYPNWELCIADDNSTRPGIREYLIELASRDPSIKLELRSVNGHISACSNSALQLATGEFIVLLDHDDLLTVHALFSIVQALNEQPELDLIYSNEDKLDKRGRRCEPTFKAGWAPDYFLALMYVGHLGVFRKTLVDKVGGFRVGFEGSQDYDLVLRVSELTTRIKHIPRILYHWRKHPESTAVNMDSKPYAYNAARKAIEQALERRQIKQATVQDGAVPGIYRCSFKSPNGFKLRVIRLPEAASNLNDYFSEQLKSSQIAEYLLIISSAIGLQDNSTLSAAIAHEVERPGLGLLTGKICKGRRILAAGAHLQAGCLTANFRGQRRGSFGYAARLICQHNINVIWPDAFIVKAEVLNKYLPDMPATNSFYVYVTYLALLLSQQGYRHLYSPYFEFEANRDFTGEVDLNSEASVFSNLGKQFDLVRYVDNQIPVDDENPDLKFSINL